MKPHILVTTWFFTHQPGYLDFSYRLRALASRYRLTVVIGHEGFREEFPGLEADFLVLPAVASTSGLLRYLMELAALSRRLKPDLVIMLGSQMAMLSLLMPGMRTLTNPHHHLPTRVSSALLLPSASKYTLTRSMPVFDVVKACAVVVVQR